MRRLARLTRIIHTFCRYRLDALLKDVQVKSRYKLLLLPFWFYPKPDISRGRALRNSLEELGPIFIKFGQLLSTRPDLIPDDIIEELNYLQDRVAPFSNEEFKRIVEQALGNNTNALFKEFSEEPLASASVAQVHTATLHTGEDVVVKVVRPNIEKIIQKDVALLELLARTIEKLSPEGRRFKLSEVVADYKDTIFDELDLKREAANASQLRRNFEGSPLLYVPAVHWQYCTNKVMVMERIYGIPVTDMEKINAQDTNLKLLAERGVEVFFKQVFEHNFFHADMHPGNVFVSPANPQNPSYMAVDMAIIGSLTKEDQYYLARNLLAMFRRDYRQVAELHVMSGWVPANTSISGFESAIRTVCEPIFERPLKDISFGESLVNLFRTARRYNMPVQPQLVLLQKTLLNIEGLGRQLYPDLNLWDTAHPYLEKWLKERYQVKTLFNNLKYHAPEWLEKFPEVPHLVFNALEKLNNQPANEHKQQISPATQRTNKALTWLGYGTLMAGLAITLATYTAIPQSAIALIAAGATLLAVTKR
ncbi:ubiquinone biosynthesis regulatory protein kinase UbiB [Saccharophagus degradans]|uniref:ubiquinone biosynthesis regulatory protein kinase UbiB n=1 Tax=Saccharophagus degradans TaxID=86304 RepID=UPI001C09E9FB|nr:ubiquinone biosynthesis regulatory protein kinase UbiB [Saccharophagus degradans]